jgi:hypothetical protein
MIAAIAKARAFYLVATIFGAILPTLVAAFVIAPLRHMLAKIGPAGRVAHCTGSNGCRSICSSHEGRDEANEISERLGRRTRQRGSSPLRTAD